MQRADLLLLLALGACAMMLLSACESASIGDPGGALDPNGGGSEYQSPGMGEDNDKQGNEPATPTPWVDGGTSPPGTSTLKDAGGTTSPADDAGAGVLMDPGYEGEIDGFPAAEDAGPDTTEDIVFPSDADDAGEIEDGGDADDAVEAEDGGEADDAEEPDDAEGSEDADDDAGEDVETDTVSGATPN